MLPDLTELSISLSDVESLENFPDYHSLELLRIVECYSLVSLEGLPEFPHLRLLGISPCLNVGLNGAMPYLHDLDANPRVVNGYVDMGAYEGPHQGFIVSTHSLDIPEGDLATFTVTLAMDPLAQVTVGAIVESDDLDITIESGNNLTFDSSNYAQPQTVTLTAAEDNDFANGMAVVTISADGFHPITIRAAESENDKVLYVDTDAQGAGTGFSWTDSFTSLSDALSVARASRVRRNQRW